MNQSRQSRGICALVFSLLFTLAIAVSAQAQSPDKITKQAIKALTANKSERV